MNRRIALCLTFGLTLPLCIGCNPGTNGVNVGGPGVAADVIKQQTIEWNVDHTSSLLLNGPDGDPGKRLMATKRAGKMISKPDLTSEMKAKLIESLNKMIENEPTSEADDATKKEIAEEGKKAVAALQGENSGQM